MRWSVAASMLVVALCGCTPRGSIEAPAKTPGLDLPGRFIALGTEPFWAAKIDGAVLVYQTPENQTGQRATLTRRVLPGRVELSGSLVGKSLLLSISPGPCSDGMSDTTYPLSAELRIGTESLRGCARPS